ncbi:MAG: hypothetical protein IJN75_00660, partial [Clostridia bacterium]|nr:hypothetical protein [Clostridia bacterium]
SLRNPSKLFVFFFPNGHSVAPWGFLFLQRKAPVGEKVCKRLWETLKKLSRVLLNCRKYIKSSEI